MRGLLGLLGSLLAATAFAQPPAGSPARTSSCLACHGDAARAGESSAKVVAAFHQDVHAEAGLSCQDCHGGNPDPALAGDMAKAMDAGYRASPFRGAPEHAEIPAFCGRCHSDATYM
jgi:hypothetical protein